MFAQGPCSTAAPLDRLVAAGRLVGAELRLDLLWPAVVVAARQLLDVDRAALAVLGPDGAPERILVAGADGVVATGVDGDLAAALTGSGPADPHGVRVVPIRGAEATLARLCLAGPADAAAFSSEDEQLLDAFAALAGVAVSNAARYGEMSRRRDWSEASAEIGQQLLGADSDIRVLEHIAESMARLAEADTVQIVLRVPDLDDTFEFAVSRGPGADQAAGLRYPAAGSIAEEAMQHPEGLVLDDVRSRLGRYGDARADLPITNLMGFPLCGAGRPRGAVVVCRADDRPFSRPEVEMARVFTNQAAIALELAEARANQARLGLLEDRDRISRTLQHDVLQRLFDTGLTLQAAAALAPNPVLSRQLGRAVTSLDDTIRSIRASIFELPPTQIMLTSVASRVVATLAQHAPPPAPAPALHLTGALGTAVDQETADDLKAVLREALHLLPPGTPPETVTVHLDAHPDQVSLTITHGGPTPADSQLTAVLLGLRERAQRAGGGLDLTATPEGGSRLRWASPRLPVPTPG